MSHRKSLTSSQIQKITFPDKGLHVDKPLVKISQILSFSQRKAKVLCGHVVKIHKNCPSGYSEKRLLCFCILSPPIQKGKKSMYSFGGTQCSFHGIRSLASQRYVNSFIWIPLCRRQRKHTLDVKVQVNLPRLALLV